MGVGFQPPEANFWPRYVSWPKMCTTTNRVRSKVNDFLGFFRCPNSQLFGDYSIYLQFAINTSKPPAPVALQGRLCLSGKPHEYKRSLVWLNLPYLAKLGIPRAGRPPLSISILQRRQGLPQPPNLPPPISAKISSLNKKKKNSDCHWRSGKTPIWL